MREIDENDPPKIVAVIRRVWAADFRLAVKIEEYDAPVSKNVVVQRRIDALGCATVEENVENERWREERDGLEKMVKEVEGECQTMLVRERVWKREASGMRSLLDTNLWLVKGLMG